MYLLLSFSFFSISNLQLFEVHYIYKCFPPMLFLFHLTQKTNLPLRILVKAGTRQCSFGMQIPFSFYKLLFVLFNKKATKSTVTPLPLRCILCKH